MQDFQLIADWISKEYASADKIVEIGVGEANQVLIELKERLPDCRLVATDVRKVSIPEDVKFALDDITKPDLSIYEGADLVFSLRSPPELYPFLREVAIKVDSDLLVKPLSSEESPPWGDLINHSGAVFYVLRT